MSRSLNYVLLFLLFPLVQSCTSETSIEYPATKTVSHSDTYHGTQISDPYRWLEEMDSQETRSWISQQNDITESFLASSSERQEIDKRLTELWNYEKFTDIRYVNGAYYYMYNDGLSNQSSLYKIVAGTQPQKVIDVNRLSTDGTAALSGYSVSPNGQYVAYFVQKAGSDWRTIRVYDQDRKVDLSDELDWIKFSGIAWTSTSRGFYYVRYPQPEKGKELSSALKGQIVYYHRAGTTQSRDQQIYNRKDKPQWLFDIEMSTDSRYLIFNIRENTNPENRIYYRDVGRSGSPVISLLDENDASYTFIGNDNNNFYFLTTWKAPKGQIIAISIKDPRRSLWKTVVEESDFPIAAAKFVNEQMVVEYTANAKSNMVIYSLEGELTHEIPLPSLGSVTTIATDPVRPVLYVGFSSFFAPNAIYRYDFKTKQLMEHQMPKLPFDPSDYEVNQVFVDSKDGTKIPMFIANKKGLVAGSKIQEIRLQREGFHPTLMYGYGGFNVTLTPSFSPRNLLWMERGGIYALVNLRGGGEYGEAWHKAGMLEKKQNVFDDFIAAAEYLINNKYTSPRKLAINGGSNGGLLVGAVMTQRPELFGAALPAVGVLDMLRFHKFTIGYAWTGEYGSSDNLDQFKFLYKYSPYHNLNAASYPATLVTTSDHDDRVVPAHSYKFLARLQEVQEGNGPVLIRVETEAGHGAGVPTEKRIAQARDELTFLEATIKK